MSTCHRTPTEQFAVKDEIDLPTEDAGVQRKRLRRLIIRTQLAALVIALYCGGCGGMKPAAADARPVRSAPVTIEVVVKLNSAAAAAAEPRRRLEECAHNIGVTLLALHPDTDDSELASYYTTRVDAAAAEKIAAQLRACPGVEGAYPKPAGEPPGRM